MTHRSLHWLPVAALGLAAILGAAPAASHAAAGEVAVQAGSSAKAAASAAGTQRYQLGLYRRGPAWTPERTPYTDSLQVGHLANMKVMSDAGALEGAGPFLDGQPLPGILIFSSDSARAATLVAADPSVVAGRLVIELVPWTGPAGIGSTYRRRQAEGTARDSMLRFAFAFVRHARPAGQDARARDRALAGHDTFMAGLAKDARLVAHGPIERSAEFHSIMVYDGKVEDLKALLAPDPAVQAGWLVPDVRPWMCGAGVMPGH
jgi:uncharacterized protein YciI